MKHLAAILTTIAMVMEYTGSEYSGCANCTEGECSGLFTSSYGYSKFYHTGSIPLSPLSYTTMRSHVFNGTQPSNEGCTNGILIDGQVIIDCGQGTTLIDCDRGYNDNADYSDLSNYFMWNMTASFGAPVSTVFKFDQQIRISRINMFFWNSPSNNIIVPNVRIYWPNHYNDDNTLFNEITQITTSSPNRTGDGQRRVSIDINIPLLQFQYLRIAMHFSENSEWIFLGDVQFCGELS